MSVFRLLGIVLCLSSVILLTTDSATAQKGGKGGGGGNQGGGNRGGGGNQGGGNQGGGNHGGGGGNHGGGNHGGGGNYSGGHGHYSGGGNYHGYGSGNHGGGGRTYLSVSPYGLGVGYQSGNFGIQIGGIGGYRGYNNYGGYGGYGGYYSTPSYYSTPAYYSTPSYYSTPIYSTSPNYYPSYSSGSTYYPPTTGTVISPSLTGDERPLYPIAEPLPSSLTPPKSVASAPVVEAARPRIIDPKASTLIEVNEAATHFELLAEQAFLKHDYEQAARLVDHALLEDSDNGKLHLFASQTRFAAGDYRAAAADLANAISLLDEGDWGYVVERYRDFYNNGDYVGQMNRLVQFNRENEDVGYALMLRGYHYLFLGHEEAAEQQLKAADIASPNDETTQKLLSLVAVDSLPVPDAIPAPRPSE